MAVWRLGAGARGPQDGVRPAAGAFELDMGIFGPASGQQFAAMAAADLCAVLLFHGVQSGCAPCHNRLC